MGNLAARWLVQAGRAAFLLGLALSPLSLIFFTRCVGFTYRGGGCGLIFDWPTLLPGVLLTGAGAYSIVLGLFRRPRRPSRFWQANVYVQSAVDLRPPVREWQKVGPVRSRNSTRSGGSSPGPTSPRCGRTGSSSSMRPWCRSFEGTK